MRSMRIPRRGHRCLWLLDRMGAHSRDVLATLGTTDLSTEAFPFGTRREIEIASARVRAPRAIVTGDQPRSGV